MHVPAGTLVRSLAPPTENGDSAGAVNGPERGSPEAASLHQYKSLIRQQDARLQELVAQLELLVRQNRTTQV